MSVVAKQFFLGKAKVEAFSDETQEEEEVLLYPELQIKILIKEKS